MTSRDSTPARRPTARTEELRALFERLSPVDTFTERQVERARGTVPSASEVDAALARQVREMRERFGFRTSLPDEDCVAVVRGTFAGRSDDEIATDLGASPAVVARARVHLHLFRPSDRDTSFPWATFVGLREEGRSLDDCAAALGASERAVRNAARLLDARTEARATGYRYPLRFAELLGVDADADEGITASLRAERELFSEVRD